MTPWRATLHTAAGPVACRLELPADTLSLADLARLAGQLSGQVQHAQLAPGAPGAAGAAGGAGAFSPPLFSCRAGCGACCRQLVCVAPAEAFALAEVLGTLPAAEAAAVVRQTTRTVQAAEAAGLADAAVRVLDPRLDDEGHYALARAWFALGQPCPFLGPDENCTIHPWRPTACREYLVTSPAAWCAEPFRRIPRPLPVAAPFSQAQMNLCAQLLGGPEGPIPLPLACAWAAAHPEFALLSWPADYLLERLLRHLEAVLAGG